MWLGRMYNLVEANPLRESWTEELFLLHIPLLVAPLINDRDIILSDPQSSASNPLIVYHTDKVYIGVQDRIPSRLDNSELNLGGTK